MSKRVAFIVSKFPCYDEAFILRELHALSQLLSISIFSLRKSKDAIVHDQAAELIQHTFYVPYLFSWKLLKANFLILVKKPARFFRAFFTLFFGNLKSPEFLLKSLVFFPKSVYLAKWLEEEKIDHMHAYWATYPTSVALVASQIAQVPFSFMGHAHDIYLDVTHLKDKMAHAEFINTCTCQNKDYLLKIAPECASEKILVQYHGLDLSKFYVDQKEGHDTLQILSVGTLHYYKGFNYLMDALAILKEQALKFHCTIIGGGPLEQDLKRHIKLLNLKQQVTMTGPLKQDEVIPYYKKADVLALMAQSEWHWGIPNVLIEALAAKTAVITTQFGSVEELIQNEKTGLIVEAKNADNLSQALARLSQDPALRKRLAETGNQLVTKKFDLKKNLNAFLERVCGHDESVFVTPDETPPKAGRDPGSSGYRLTPA